MSDAGKKMLAEVQQMIDEQENALTQAHARLNARRERAMAHGAQDHHINEAMKHALMVDLNTVYATN